MLDAARMGEVVRRGPGAAEMVEAWRAVDTRRKTLQGEVDELRQQRNAANERMARLDKSSAEFAAARDELRSLSRRVKEGEGELSAAETEARDLWMALPNAPHETVPDGAGEEANQVHSVWGERPTYDFEPVPHWDLGEALGILDFEAAGRISGTRFAILRGAASRLSRALISYMLDLHTQRGYAEIWPPAIVRGSALMGTGQLPKFAADLFRLEGDADWYLSPTAEVQLTNLHADQILDAEQLPLCYVGYAPCFRSEAGSAGRDTRGLIRLHQFDKVELVKFTTPETSYQELDRLRDDAEAVLRGLGLHYRVVTLCTGDLSAASAKTFDLEVWLPGQQLYREISSCSNFEAYQARRAKVRYRTGKGEKPRMVHTLNGSGLAVGRTIVAILEQGQRADGSVVIPEALRPYMGGQEVIERSS